MAHVDGNQVTHVVDFQDGNIAFRSGATHLRLDLPSTAFKALREQARQIAMLQPARELRLQRAVDTTRHRLPARRWPAFMMEFLASARRRLERAWRFFSHEVWETRLTELPSRKAFGYRAARIVYCTFRGLFFEEMLNIRAAALTYFTVLSLVPLLAFSFALLKGFGAYDVLVDQTIRPYLSALLEGNDALQRAFDQMLGFVEQTGVASLGFIGLLFLLYAATRLLRNIEGALNEIWGARSARDLFQQTRDYVAIMLVLPLSLLAAGALTTFGQALDLLRAAGETLGVSGLLDRAISLVSPLTVLFLSLLFVYTVLPNATVKLRSAAVGALIGSVAWYLTLIAHVRFQVGVARFNALYSGFAAFPIFLAWLHVSWLIVLVGAQIASTHQHHLSLARRARIADADSAFKEAVCLSAVLEIVRAFVHGTPFPTRQALSLRFDAPEEVISELLDRLVDAGMLVRAGASGDGAYALAKSPDRIRVKDVLDALRRSPSFQPERREAAGLDRVASQIWLDLDRALERSPANWSLQQIIDQEERGTAPAIPAGTDERDDARH
jgi:membrane protein